MRKTRITLPAEVKAERSGLIDGWLVTFCTHWGKIETHVKETEIADYAVLNQEQQLYHAVVVAKDKIEGELR